MRGSEPAQLEAMISFLSVFNPSLGKQDGWKWALTKDGIYSVRSAYAKIQEHAVLISDKSFSILWSLPIPSSAAALVWKLFLDRLQTRDNLRKRAILVDLADCLCPLCLEAEESSAHLFFTCQVVWRVWMSIYNWLGFSTVLHEDGKSHFWANEWGFKSLSQRQVGWSIWTAVVSSVWNIRNDMLFRGAVCDVAKVVDQCKFNSWVWLQAKLPDFKFSWYEWHQHPWLCCSQV